MESAIKETKYRRQLQEAYNKEHGITPTTVKKAISDMLERQKEEAQESATMDLEVLKKGVNLFKASDRKKLIKRLTQEMEACAERMEYEQAAVYRDQIRELETTYGK